MKQWSVRRRTAVVQMIVRLFVVACAVVGCATASAGATNRQVPSPVQAESAPGPQQARDPASVDVSELPVSVPRIEHQLGLPSTLRLEVARPMFRVEVIEKRPKWFADIEWIPSADARLPMPTGPAWHRDYLAMVTPPEALLFGQSSGLDLLQLMATSLVEGMTTKAVARKVKSVAAARRASKARHEVDDAIEAWKLERQTPPTREDPHQDPHPPEDQRD